MTQAVRFVDVSFLSNADFLQEVAVSGPLAPFDEPVTIAFRGPINLHNLVWYEGEADLVEQTSSWTPS